MWDVGRVRGAGCGWAVVGCGCVPTARLGRSGALLPRTVSQSPSFGLPRQAQVTSIAGVQVQRQPGYASLVHTNRSVLYHAVIDSQTLLVEKTQATKKPTYEPPYFTEGISGKTQNHKKTLIYQNREYPRESTSRMGFFGGPNRDFSGRAQPLVMCDYVPL